MSVNILITCNLISTLRYDVCNDFDYQIKIKFSFGFFQDMILFEQSRVNNR